MNLIIFSGCKPSCAFHKGLSVIIILLDLCQQCFHVVCMVWSVDTYSVSGCLLVQLADEVFGQLAEWEDEGVSALLLAVEHLALELLQLLLGEDKRLWF